MGCWEYFDSSAHHHVGRHPLARASCSAFFYSWILIIPFNSGWSASWYPYVPGLRFLVLNDFVLPGRKTPISNFPISEVTEWLTLSVFLKMSIAPCPSVVVFGLYPSSSTETLALILAETSAPISRFSRSLRVVVAVFVEMVVVLGSPSRLREVIASRGAQPAPKLARMMREIRAFRIWP